MNTSPLIPLPIAAQRGEGNYQTARRAVPTIATRYLVAYAACAMLLLASLVTSTPTFAQFNFFDPALLAGKVAGPAAGTNYFVIPTGTGNGQVKEPSGLAVDDAGNLYVVDVGNSRIEKFDSSGNYLLQWGSHGSGNGQFNFYNIEPIGIAVSGTNVYVADNSNYRIQKFDTSGNYLLQFGGYGSGNGPAAGNGLFDLVSGLAVSGTNVYVADYWNHRVERFDTGGAYLSQWGDYGSGNGQFSYPIGLAVSGANVFVVEGGGLRVQKFDATGTYISQFTDAAWWYPVAIAVDASANVYVADYFGANADALSEYDSTGTVLGRWNSYTGSPGTFNEVFGLALYQTGTTTDLWMSDNDNNVVVEIQIVK